MEKKALVVLALMLTSGIIAACGPSQSKLDAQATEIAANIFATQTAEAPTSTSTSTPTSTTTPTPTSTPTSTPMSTTTLPQLPVGWRYHSVSDFNIALPERWEVVDIEEEGFEALWNLIGAIDTEWARTLTSMLSAELMQEALMFWAMDIEPAGIGYATANISFQSMPLLIGIDDLCAQMQSLYEQLEIEVVESDCGLEINGLDAARLTVVIKVGTLASKEFQYIYVQEPRIWILTLAVDETEWSDYESIFVVIAESFRIEGQGYDQAISELIAAIDEEPDNAWLYFLRGKAYYNRYETAYEINDPSADYRDFYRAIDDFTRAIELDPLFVEAYNYRGLTFLALGQNEDALDDYNMAITIDPELSSSYYGRALVYEDWGILRSAINDYKRYLELSDDPFWIAEAEKRLDALQKVATICEVSQRNLIADAIYGERGSQPGQFVLPRDVALNQEGEIFLTDSLNHRIQHLSSEGDVLHIWGHFASVEEGDAPGGTFNEPWGIGVAPDGTVYVADTWNHRIQYFTATGEFLGMFGYFGQGQADTPDAFWGPRDVAVDSQGLVYVADTGNKRIVIFDKDGSPLSIISQGFGSGEGELDEPIGLGFDTEDRLYVADTWNQRIQVFEQVTDGVVEAVAEWPVYSWYSRSLDNKPYIALDGTGRVFITDPEGYRVMAFSESGDLQYCFGSYGKDNSSFGLPMGLAYDSNDGLYVVDADNNRLMHFVIKDHGE